MSDDASSHPRPDPLAARTRRLLTAPVASTLLRLAAPNVGEAAARIAFIACDALFVGWLGTDALAGVALAFPIFLVMQMASAGGIGAGVNAAIARAIGAGRRDDAAAIALLAGLLAIGIGLVVAVAMVAAGPALYRTMGAQGAALDAALVYSGIVFGGSVAVWSMNLLANVVRGTGEMRVPATAIVVGEAVHLALSPVLILGLGPIPSIGIAGAAIAVVAAYGTGTIVLLAYLAAGRAGLARPPLRSIQRRHLRAVLGVGVPASLNILQIQLTTIIATALMAVFGPTTLAGFGIAARLDLLQIPLTFALGTAMIAMVATNAGAGATDRVRQVAIVGTTCAIGIGGVFAIVALLLPAAWTSLFTDDTASIAAGVAYLRIVGPTYPVVGMALGLFFALLGAGRALPAFLSGTLRLATVAIVGGAVVHRLDGSPDALSWAIAVAGIAFAATMALAAWPMMRKSGDRATRLR